MTIVYNKLKTFSVKNAKDFYIKRIARITPLYILALILTSLCLIDQFSITHFLESLFFIQAWIPQDALTLNFPGWSLSVEMFFYLLFPFIFPLISSNKKIPFIIWGVSNLAIVILCFGFNQDNTIINQFTKYFPLLHLNQFLIGITAGFFYLKGIKKNNALFIFSFLFLIIYLPLISQGTLPTLHHDGLLAPIFALLIVGATSSTSFIKKILTNPFFIKMGNASYGMYILQFPIYYITYKIYKTLNIYSYLGEEGRFYTYLIVLILIAFLSSITFEIWTKNIFLKKNK